MTTRARGLFHKLLSRIDRIHDKCSPLVVMEWREFGTWSSVRWHNVTTCPSRLGRNPMKNVGLGSMSFIMDQFQAPQTFKSFSTKSFSGNDYGGNQASGSFESADEFERRIFGGSSGNNQKSDIFFRKLDKLEKAYGKSGSALNEGDGFGILDGLDDSFTTFSDGMDGKLKKAATYFDFDEDEIVQEDYYFRPDMSFRGGSAYDVKDLDLTKPRVTKFRDRQAFQVTTEEVLKKADFRNVKFLANFITEAGIIIKRRQTRISAKAQRKVAREIKTARAFGLMPFTTMGTKSFVFGKTMKDLGEDYEYETFDGRLIGDDKDIEE